MMTTKIKPRNEAMEPAVQALADLFSGADVAHHSCALQVGGFVGAQAKRYFAAREALGIRGWDTREQAEEAIRIALAL